MEISKKKTAEESVRELMKRMCSENPSANGSFSASEPMDDGSMIDLSIQIDDRDVYIII